MDIKCNASKLKKIVIIFFAAFSYPSNAQENSTVATSEVSKVTYPSSLYFSPAMKEIISSGIDIPVLIANANNQADTDDIVIGSAKVIYENEQLLIKSFSIGRNDKHIELSSELKAHLRELKDVAFIGTDTVTIDENAKLKFDVLKMSLTLQVAQNGFGVKELKRSSLLPMASNRTISGMLNYNANINHSMGDSSSTSSYLGFNSIQSLGEHHLYIDGSAYTSESAGGNDLTLDRVMYERDINGQRLAFGMMDAWSLQSLGQVSTLGGTQMWGASFGNVSQSYKQDSSQSLTPLNVYFSSAGEARIYRDGRLLSVQQQAMGNHELDARTLPSGIYDVQVDVVVAGKVVSSRNYRVNKPNNNGMRGDELSWQVWGGMGKDSSGYGNPGRDDEQKSNTVMGLSLAGRAFEADWNASGYYNRDTWVEETSVSRKIGEVQIDLQNVFASDGTRHHLAALSVPLFYGLGSVNYAKEGGREGDRLDYQVQKRDSLGLSLNLSAMQADLGNLNINLDRYGDKTEGNRQLRWDYTQQLYNGNMGSVSLNLGNSYETTYSQSYKMGTHSRYAMLNLSIPLGADFSIGYSHNDTGSNLDLSVGKSFDDSAINYANINLSKQMDGTNNEVNYNAYADFDTSIGSGMLSVMGGKGNTSLTLNGTGSVGWGEGGISVDGRSGGEAGVIIENPASESGALEAKINGQNYPLSAGRNFVPLAPYQNYTIEVQPTGDGDASYDIDDTVSEVVLYPGNVTHFQPKIKQMVTVFGRLLMPDGKPLAGAKLHNHIGSTQTDADGRFSIDVDHATPELQVDTEATGHFKVDIDLLKKQGALMVEDIVWTGANVKAKARTTAVAVPQAESVINPDEMLVQPLIEQNQATLKVESQANKPLLSKIPDVKQGAVTEINQITEMKQHTETQYSTGKKEVTDVETKTISKKTIPDQNSVNKSFFKERTEETRFSEIRRSAS